MEIKCCRSCDGTSLRTILDLGEQPWCNDFRYDPSEEVPVYPLKLLWCNNCTLLQLSYTVPKEVMFTDHAYRSGTTKTLRKHFDDFAEENIEQFNLKGNDLIIDIGGNDGTQLLSYKERGLGNCWNVESCKGAVKDSLENDIYTVPEFFTEEVALNNFKEGSAKLINAAGVYFHLEDLHSVTKGVKQILAADGVFTVQAMYAGAMLENNSFDMIYHEHLCYYSLKSLENLLHRHNLEVFDAYFSPIHSGSLIAKIGHPGKHEKTERYKKSKFLDENWCYLEAFLNLGGFVQAWSSNLRNLLLRYRNLGKTVYAYGAPAKGNTLLNTCLIHADLIPVAVEINPLKVGTYMPGSKIPVVHEYDVELPDYYLLLAHNFAEEIINRNRDYIINGDLGVIVPFPQLGVLDKESYEAGLEVSK